MLMQKWLCGIILAINAGACNSMTEPDVAPPGTIQSAQRLTLGFGIGALGQSTLKVGACISQTGLCLPEELLTRDDCHDYSGAEFTFDGAVITQTEGGGYFPGEDGCTYPNFEAQFPSQRFALNGPHQLTLRIAGETVSLPIAESLEDRRITLISGKLVGGSDASVLVEPRPSLISDSTIVFYYDDNDLNEQWCFEKNKWHGVDPLLAKVPADAWNEQGFSFQVPTSMPNGLGTLSIDDSFNGSVTPCPFFKCRVDIGHDVDIASVEVTHP